MREKEEQDGVNGAGLSGESRSVENDEPGSLKMRRRA